MACSTHLANTLRLRAPRVKWLVWEVSIEKNSHAPTYAIARIVIAPVTDGCGENKLGPFHRDFRLRTKQTGMDTSFDGRNGQHRFL